MSARADATLAAVVAALADAGHDAGTPAFRARDVAPIRATSWLRVAARTVELHMRAAGYAVSSATAGAMVLTPAGLAAVEAARRARGGALEAGPASGAGADAPGDRIALTSPESGGFPQRGGGDRPASPCVGRCESDDAAVCRGCARTMAEIAGWGAMGDAEKRRVLERIAEMAGTGRAA